MKRNNIYADYDEKFVKSVILYGKAANNKLYFDAAYKEEVGRAEAKDIFQKGMFVVVGEFLCSVGTMKDIPASEKVEFKIYSGSAWVTYTSYNLVVTPVEPDFDDSTGVITIPDLVTMSYFIGESELSVGAQTPLERDTPVTVTAVPADGYSFEPGAVDEWTFEWESEEVTPEAPVLNEATGVITIPDVEGVTYYDDATPLNAGAMSPISKNTPKTITAKADDGYKFPDSAVDEWVFEWVLTLVEPTAPTFDEGTGVITIPTKTGVIYKDEGGTVLNAGAQSPITEDEPYTVNAVPDDGYKFADDATATWVFEWSQAV